MSQCLLLLSYLVRNGSERVVTSAREHIYDLRSLENYTYVDDVGKDQVRNNYEMNLHFIFKAEGLISAIGVSGKLKPAIHYCEFTLCCILVYLTRKESNHTIGKLSKDFISHCVCPRFGIATSMRHISVKFWASTKYLLHQVKKIFNKRFSNRKVINCQLLPGVKSDHMGQVVSR